MACFFFYLQQFTRAKNIAISMETMRAIKRLEKNYKEKEKNSSSNQYVLSMITS